MDIVKRFWFPIVCGVIALIAVALTIYPLGGWVSDVEKTMKDQAGTYSQLEGLLVKNRKVPNLVAAGGQSVKLTDFPTSAMIERTRAAATELADAARKMLDAAVKMNQRDPLVRGALPSPSPQDAFRFRDEYARYMSQTLPAFMGATAPPGDAELKAEQDRIWERDFAPKIVSGPNGPLNEDQKRQEFEEEIKALPEQFNREWASRHRIYMESDTLARAGGIEGSQAPGAAAIWDAQLLTWIQSDILDAIQQINSASTSILDAPVKHIAALQVQTTPVMPSIPADATADAAPILQAPTEPLTFDFTVSPTGRVSNGLFDVFPVSLVINVDASQVPRVLADLSRNRLVYVRKTDLRPVDLTQAETAGFYYGSVPIVQLTIDAEVLLLRAWTEPLMPAIVKQTQGLSTDAARPG